MQELWCRCICVENCLCLIINIILYAVSSITFISIGMRVIFAYYGLRCSNGDINNQNQYRSTQWVASLCNGKNYCTGVVSVNILGDPYPGCCKDFLAVAECSNGQIVADAVRCEANGQHFALACYWFLHGLSCKHWIQLWLDWINVVSM